VAYGTCYHRRKDSAKELLSLHLPSVPFNEDGWRYILEHHGGTLPIKIKAVKEGSIIPVKNILFSVENTDPKCYWLVGYLETLLVQVRKINGSHNLGIRLLQN